MNDLHSRLAILEAQIPRNGSVLHKLTYMKKTMEKFYLLVPIMENFIKNDTNSKNSTQREVIIYQMIQFRTQLDLMDEILRLLPSLNHFNEILPLISLDFKYRTILQRLNEINSKFHACVIRFIYLLQRSVLLRYKQESLKDSNGTS